MLQPGELRMLQALDREDFMAVVRLIQSLYMKTVYKREVANERSRRGIKAEFHSVESRGIGGGA